MGKAKASQEGITITMNKESHNLVEVAEMVEAKASRDFIRINGVTYKVIEKPWRGGDESLAPQSTSLQLHDFTPTLFSNFTFHLCFFNFTFQRHLPHSDFATIQLPSPHLLSILNCPL